MPIPRTQLEEASRPLEERIVKLLSANRDAAYSMPELFASLEGYDKTTALMIAAFSTNQEVMARYNETLAKLVNGGKLVAAAHQGILYYAIAT